MEIDQPHPTEMPGEDEAPDFLLEIGPEESFKFHCGPDVACFNRCCSELALPLTPYDVLRLRRQLGIGSDELLNTFSIIRSYPDSGFPLPFLRMIESPDAPCPFVTPAGCSVYADRPGACRSYPLGRGSRMAKNGIKERFFLVQEPHCKGFDYGPTWTPVQWFIEEGLEPYNRFNDRYMRLISLVRASGKSLNSRLATMALLCLYQLERFRDLIVKMNIFAHVDITEQHQNLIMEDSLSGNEACLDFALDWMEITLFGKKQNLNQEGK